MTKDQAIADLVAVGRQCRGTLPENARAIVVAALRAGDEAAAREADAQGRAMWCLEKLRRELCGWDVNQALVAEVEANGFKGQEVEVTCAECGTVSSHRLARYDEPVTS